LRAYTDAHSNRNTYLDRDSHRHSDGYIYADTYSHGNVHAYSNSDCYSHGRNSDSDAHLRAGCDLVRNFKRFWYRG
jgi:hypothetical protein